MSNGSAALQFATGSALEMRLRLQGREGEKQRDAANGDILNGSSARLPASAIVELSISLSRIFSDSRLK